MNTAALVSLLTTLLAGLFTLLVGRQFLARRKPHQLAWALALLFFTVGTGCQFLAGWNGWNETIYRLWYLTGAILTAAYFGQGTLYLQARRRTGHVVMALLLAASLIAAVLVWRSPVDLDQALAGVSVSGAGMPRPVRLLTPLFNVFGTLLLVGGAVKSSWFFLWNGLSNSRAAGTGLIALGALVVAFGGTLARFSFPAALYLTELLGVSVIFAGYLLTNRKSESVQYTPTELTRRRKRISSFAVRGGLLTIFALLASLPVLPWVMGIVTDMQHTLITELPEDNKGAYLLLDQGVMQLYTWRVEPVEYPTDAPLLEKDSLHAVAVVQKQFDPIDNFLLYNLTTGERFYWPEAEQSGTQLRLETGPLPPGDYMLVVPTDSMYGGNTYHYFRLQ